MKKKCIEDERKPSGKKGRRNRREKRKIALKLVDEADRRRKFCFERERPIERRKITFDYHLDPPFFLVHSCIHTRARIHAPTRDTRSCLHRATHPPAPHCFVFFFVGRCSTPVERSGFMPNLTNVLPRMTMPMNST